MCIVRSTHINPVQFVSDLQVGVDAVLVNVADNRHVGHSVRGSGALGDEARPIEDRGSSHRLVITCTRPSPQASRVNAQFKRGRAPLRHNTSMCVSTTYKARTAIILKTIGLSAERAKVSMLTYIPIYSTHASLALQAPIAQELTSCQSYLSIQLYYSLLYY